MWVEFEGLSAERFVSLAAAGDDELACDIGGAVPWDRFSSLEEFEAYRREHAWRYRALPLRRDGGGVWFVISVRFPRPDLDAVVAAFRRGAVTVGDRSGRRPIGRAGACGALEAARARVDRAY